MNLGGDFGLDRLDHVDRNGNRTLTTLISCVGMLCFFVVNLGGDFGLDQVDHVNRNRTLTSLISCAGRLFSVCLSMV